MSELLALAFGAALGSMLTFGILEANDTVRQDAIKAGVAEWTIDRQTGEKHFRWITPTVKGDDAQ